MVAQVLKIIRYTSKLVLASALVDPKSEAALRLKAFEASIGTSRSGYLASAHQTTSPQARPLLYILSCPAGSPRSASLKPCGMQMFQA